MPLVQGTYQPSALNPLLVPVSDAPPIDNDPYSPTYGQPTYSNLRPRANTPDVGTTAKGNPGQPGASVPTTDAPGASPPLPNVDATFTMQPAGAPKAQAKTPPKTAAKPAEEEVPDYLGNAKPQVDDRGKPPQTQAAPAQPAAPAEDGTPDYLGNAQPQVDTHGKSAVPAYTGQYLSAGTSAGAQAVGTPPVEGFVPGAGVQAAINTASDPGQRAAIAARQLGIPLDRIIVDAGGGRMAAVGDNGVPYYIEPQPFFTDQSGITKTPEGHWQPMGALQVTPYSRAEPIAAESPMTRDISPNVGGAIPSAVQSALTYVPAAASEAAGGPVVGAATAGGMRYATGALRQMIANALTRNKDYQQPVFTSQLGLDALLDAGFWGAGSLATRAFLPGPTGQIGLGGVPGFGRATITRQQPYGLQGQLAPWEAPQRWELPPGPLTPPGNPPGLPPPGARIQPPAIGAPTPAGEASPASMPVPGAMPLRPGETWLPGEDAAATGGAPNAKSSAQIAAEDRAIPTEPPPLRFPLMSDAAIKERAKDVLRWFMAGGNTVPEAGVEGNLAEVTGNRGAAALLRSMRDRAGPIANDIGVQEEERAAANRATLGKLEGDEDQLNALRDARQRQTADLEAKAVAGKTTTNPDDVLDVIDKQLNSRAAQDPQVAAALRDVRDRLHMSDPVTGKPILDESGNPVLQTDPELLMGLRQSIAREMTRQAQSGRPDMRLASLQLSPVLDQLDAAITRGMPDYPAFNRAYREASKPITAMEYLQGRNMVDTATQTPQLGAVQRTLDNIYDQRVLKKGWQPAMDLSQEQIDQLTALRDQLRRQHNIRNGMAIGSPTFEKFTTSQASNLLGSVAPQVVRPLVATALGVHEFGIGGAVLGGFEQAAEHMMAKRQFAVQQKFNQELTKLLLNRNGEGVAALHEAPGSPNALQQ